ncbi:MAG: hypothetical protein U9N59_01730 [Campylobacterota bacterium]|nr:hypothetical protein [Campylobacterota bacterium]
MKEICINGLIFQYDRERELFNNLLKINGVTKKDFCKKFSLSYSYVNAWGSIIKDKEKKYPNWVFIYLKDIMFFKISAIRVKISLSNLNERLETGKNLSDIYKELYVMVDDYNDLSYL